MASQRDQSPFHAALRPPHYGRTSLSLWKHLMGHHPLRCADIWDHHALQDMEWGHEGLAVTTWRCQYRPFPEPHGLASSHGHCKPCTLETPSSTRLTRQETQPCVATKTWRWISISSPLATSTSPHCPSDVVVPPASVSIHETCNLWALELENVLRNVLGSLEE